MYKFLVALLFSVVGGQSILGHNTDEFNKYLNEYKKDYNNTPEYWKHYYNFRDNIKKITKHNAQKKSWVPL